MIRLMKPLLLVLLAYLRGTSAFCPRDGVSGSNVGSCFYAVASLGDQSFGTGQSFCAEFYGHMASVTNAFDNRIILELAQRTFPSSASIWLGATYDGQTVIWADGLPDGYRNFQTPTPTPGDVYMDLATGQWLTSKTAGTTMPFVCGMYDDSANISTATTQPATCPTCPTCPLYAPCPNNYFYSAELKNCYKGLYNILHDTAETQCQQDGAHLASIHSLAENNLLIQMFKRGDKTSDQTQYPIIGAHRTGAGKTDWEWIDGTPFDYTYWADKEPDNSKGNEYCIVLYTDRGGDDQDHWNDERCDQTQRVAICKIPAKY